MTRHLTLMTAAALLVVLLAPGEHDMNSRVARSKTKRSVGALPMTTMYYYAMRQEGNPGIDVDAMRMRAFEQLRQREHTAMDKGARFFAAEWSERGPWNIGGRIRSIVNDPSNPTVLYAGSASGGVWKTTNLGQSWFPLTDHMPTLGFGALAIDPNNPQRIFAASGEPLDQSGRVNASFIISASQGIFKSEDGGSTWSIIPWPSATGGVHQIIVHPHSADTLLVATRSGLYKTGNGGATWTRTLNGVITDVAFKTDNPAIVYAALGPNNGGTGNGVYISHAGGDRFSFARLDTNFPRADSCGRIALALTPGDPNRIYAAVALNGRMQSNRLRDFYLVMVSRDGGQTWQRKINAVAANVTNGQSWYDLALAASPANPDIVFIGGIHVHRSTNGGTSFQQVSTSSSVHVDIHSISFKRDDPNTVIVGCDGGVFTSSNGGTTWFARYTNLGTIQYYACTYDPADPSKIFGGTQDNGTHGLLSGSNSSWSNLFGGDGGNTAIDPRNSNIRYFTSASVDANGNIFRPIYRTGVGATLRMDEGLGSGATADKFTWVPALMFHPTDPTRLYTATQYVYTVKNPSAGTPIWRIISPDVALGGGIVSDFDVPLANGNRMYVVTSNGRAHVTSNLQSSDPEWTNISAGLPARWLADITADYDNPDVAYVAASGYGTGHAFKTTDAGATWIDISGDLPDVPAGAIVRSRTDPNTLFIATDLGVWATNNGGTTWKRFGDNMPNVVVYDMKITPDNVLIAGTHGRGMWTASAILSAGAAEASPVSLQIGQNYPNPFNPSTTIPLTLARTTHVRVDVHDARGLRVATLLDGVRTAGEYRIPFAAEGLPGGVYYYSMSAEGKRSVRKMLLIK